MATKFRQKFYETSIVAKDDCHSLDHFDSHFIYLIMQSPRENPSNVIAGPSLSLECGGSCFSQILGTYTSDPEKTCGCELVVCPYFAMCGAGGMPERLRDSHGGLCLSCDFRFGRMEQLDVDCPVCFEENVPGVRLPACAHVICMTCFKGVFGVKEYPHLEALIPVCPVEDAVYDSWCEMPREEFNTLHPGKQELCDAWDDVISLVQEEIEERRTEDDVNRCRCPMCRGVLVPDWSMHSS